MSQAEWLAYRTRGLGASENATVMGLNQYKSNIQLFYEKLGQAVYIPENIYMFMGKEQEDFIANLWQYWEGSEESMIANYRAGKIIRKCRRVNAYVHNPKYPWLFVSLDREINKHGQKDNGALEIKTISGYEMDKWEGGFPPAYVIQIQTQLLVCEYTYGESAILKDGRRMEVLPFDLHKGICQSIVTQTKDFWERVTNARRVLTQKFEAERTFNYKLAQECEAELQRLEPDPDGSEAYADFLKVKYQIARPGERKGTDPELAWATDHYKISQKMKALEEKRRFCENNLKNSMKDNITRLTFGDNGFISWATDVNKVRRFLNKLKV